MKNSVTLLLVFISTVCNAQWNNVGQVIYGEPGEATGASCFINNLGDRIAIYDAFPNGDVRGRVRIFELQNGIWEQLGNGILGLIGLPNTSAGAVVINEVGNRFICEC